MYPFVHLRFEWNSKYVGGLVENARLGTQLSLGKQRALGQKKGREGKKKVANVGRDILLDKPPRRWAVEPKLNRGEDGKTKRKKYNHERAGRKG